MKPSLPKFPKIVPAKKKKEASRSPESSNKEEFRVYAKNLYETNKIV